MPESGSDTRFEDLYHRVQEIDTIVYTIFLNTEDDTHVNFAGSPPGAPGWPGPHRSGGFGGSFPMPFPFPFPSANPNPIPRPRQIPADTEDGVYRIAREQLRAIADQTGGRMYSPRKSDELSGVYSEIALDLRVQYQLGYNSTNLEHDGKWRTIRVELGNNPEAVVRTRHGYYARKEMTQ
jgi:VWFA-related protein